MDREDIIAWMERRQLTNRSLAELLGISEDKVSKSLARTGKPRRWQGAEVARLIDLMADNELLVQSEVRGTGMSVVEAERAWRGPPQQKPVPLLGTAYGGDWDGLKNVETTELRLSEVLDYIARPPSLTDDIEAYVVEIVGDSMAPRFEPGERAFVSPRAPVRPHDDVIVQIANGHVDGSDLAGAVTEVLIKRLVKRTAKSVELRQFNPDQTFTVPIEKIATVGGKLAIHRVKGRL